MGKQGAQSSGTADQQQARMMAYDTTITSFNTARLSGVAYPLLRSLMDQTDPVSEICAPAHHISCNFLPPKASMTHQTYQFLASIVDESPAHPSAEHMGASVSSIGTAERKYARAYLGDPERREAMQLRRQIAAGAQRSLETQ